jgi:hypothetical protein
MAGTMLDQELTEGLKQAKKAPRNFALIAKGANPVKLMVRKKKFRDGELAKAKAEAKGNDVVTGVLVASGADFAFQVLVEPTVKPIKLKELIVEQTEMTAKPRWEVVPTLPEIGSDEDEQAEMEADETPPGSPPPLTTGVEDEQDESDAEDLPPTAPPTIDAKQLIAAMNKLSPQVQSAAAANPDRKKDFVQPVAAFQQFIKSGQLDQAQKALGQLIDLLKSAVPATAPPTGKTGQVSLVKLGKARLEWIGVRDAALADIRKLQGAIAAEFRNDAEQTQELKAALTRLNESIRELEAKLHEELDQVLNAEEAARPALVGVARKTLTRLTSYLDSDPIMAELDDNEVVPGMKVVAPVRAKLDEISAALG